MEQLKQVKTKFKRGDNQHVKTLTIESLPNTVFTIDRFLRVYKMRFPNYVVLNLLCNHYLKTGKGLTVYSLANILNPDRSGRGEITGTMAKVNKLLSDGLIEINGYARWNSHVYIPTQRVLKELQAMCDAVNEG